METDVIYKWFGVLYMFAVFCFGVVIAISVIERLEHKDSSVGTKRKVVKEATVTETETQTVTTAVTETTATTAIDVQQLQQQHNEHQHKSESLQAAIREQLPFVPVSVAWRNICYSVTVATKSATPEQQQQHSIDRTVHPASEQKMLLRDVSGCCLPGQLVALMGSSGAGKTTLLDVLTGRKSAGVTTGTVSFAAVRGHSNSSSNTDSHVIHNNSDVNVGYVEQESLLMPFATVYETLLFSAQLRLKTNSNSSRQQQHELMLLFVEEMLLLLELDGVRDRIVGDESNPVLSPAQKKLLCVGVEMVANPSVLTLDEPTTGMQQQQRQRQKCG